MRIELYLKVSNNRSMADLIEMDRREVPVRCVEIARLMAAH